MTRETVCALRREIAKLEGRLLPASPPPSLPIPAGPPALEEVVVRQEGRSCADGIATTGAAALDRALGGGLPDAALLELHGAQGRDAAAVAGFGLALACLRLAGTGPVLWIVTAEIAGEAGLPCLAGLRAMLGGLPARLLLARARRLRDALWLAEEAVGVCGLGAVILETPGTSPQPDLTATRRLDARARANRRLLLLVRHAAPEPAPTAARLRLRIGPARAAERRILTGGLRGTIGPPAFRVTVSKNRAAPPASLLLEWNPHERRFTERTPEDPRSVVPLSRHGADPAPQAGAVLALGRGKPGALGLEPAGRERAGGRRPGRAG